VAPVFYVWGASVSNWEENVEHVYLHAYESVAEARQELTSYFTFYNSHRPHSSLGGMTPDTAYFGKREARIAA
jgi:putative transposase